MQKTFFKHNTGFFFVEDVLSAQRVSPNKVHVQFTSGEGFISHEEYKQLLQLLPTIPQTCSKDLGEGRLYE